MIFKVRWIQLGGHYHCDLFSARQPNTTFANNGHIVFGSKEEFEDFQIACPGILIWEKQHETT